MGIKRLKSLITEISSKIKNFNDLKDFRRSENLRLSTELRKENKCYVMGIDAMMFVRRYVSTFNIPEVGILNQVLKTLEANIIPFYVFDGTASSSKGKILEQRKKKNKKNEERLKEAVNKLDNFEKNIIDIHMINNELLSLNGKPNFLKNESEENKDIARLKKKVVHITADDINNVKNFLDMLGIPHITAYGEADDMIAYLYNKKIINACLSDDMDMLPKGCGNLVQIGNGGTATQFLLSDILKDFKLEYAEFIDLCILLGCDYYPNYLPRLKANELYYFFCEHPSLEKFIEAYSSNDPEIIKHLSPYQEARKLFSEQEKEEKIFHEFVRKKVGVMGKSYLLFDTIPHLSFDIIEQYFMDRNVILGDYNCKKYKRQLGQINNYQKRKYDKHVNRTTRWNSIGTR